VPLSFYCFNVKALFAPPGVAELDSDPAMLPYSSDPNISWQIWSGHLYSVNQNYSNIQYEQQDPDSPDKGRDALRILETFGAPNCFQGAMPDGRGVLPILGWSCQSSPGGDCYTASYNIVSFRVGPAGPVNSRPGKCWVASTGTAEHSAHRKSALTLLAMVVLIITTWWMFEP